MSMKKILIVASGIAVAMTAQAQPELPGNKLPIKDTVKQLEIVQPDFGSYKVEWNLQFVPASAVGNKKVVHKMGKMAIVETTTLSNVNTNSVVRNILTGNLAPVSGNINVLLKPGVTADQVSSQLGLTLVVSYPNTRLAVFKAADDADLIDTASAIKATGLVSNARIEVLDTIYTAD